MPSVLAVDLGGTKTALAVVDESGHVSDYRKQPATASLEELAARIGQAANSAEAVGVVVPGIYSDDTGRAWCPNLFGNAEVPLRDALRERLGGRPVAIDSDRTGAVAGESWLGIAHGRRHVVFVAVGTGIGIGVLADGRVIRGARGIAGAAGWWSLTPDWHDVYQATGCWESEAAGPAVARAAGAGGAESVVIAARSGDPHALRIVTHAADYTGRAVANLISMFDPEMVVLGGGFLCGAGDLMLDPIRSVALQWAQPISVRQCPIEMTTLGENAGLMGAARIALDLF